MAGHIDMGEGDNTDPWDILKAGIGGISGFGEGPRNKAKTGSTGAAYKPVSGYSSVNPYADPFQRERAVWSAITSARRTGNRSDAPNAARANTFQSAHTRPVFKTPFMNDFYEAVLPHVGLIASTPYNDNPFYKNNPVVGNWYKKIHATAGKESNTTGRASLGLDGQIAAEPYTRRAYTLPETKPVSSAIPSETETDAAACQPVKDTITKWRPFGWVENIVGTERIKQTEDTIKRFLNIGTRSRTSTQYNQPLAQNTGDPYGNPDPRPHLHENPSSDPAGQKTPTPASQNNMPLIQSETEQASESGKDLHEAIKTVVPDAGVAAIVATGKAIRDAARLTAFISGTDKPNQLADHIDKQAGQFIKTSGSDTLNRQRDTINQTLENKQADGADIAQTLIQNPYGALFGAGTELAGIAVPGGAAKLLQQGIKWGGKLAPKAIEYGARLLPYVPQAVQTLQGVGESLRQSQNDEPAIRTLKALGTGAITAAGSLASKGGLAGEIGKRLSNQISNGTVRTATDLGGAILKQGLLSGTQSAGGAVSDKLAEGKLPDMNEVGKLAVKGAVDGGLGGAALHHAMVPTERRAGRMIEAAGNGNRNAHSQSKHGTQTTKEQQLTRANTGQAPDGSVDKKLRDASKWLRNVDNSDGIAVARRRWEELKRLDPGKNDNILIAFDKPIGEGYLKGTNTLIKTSTGVFRFNEKGDLITSYPLLPKN